MTEYGLFNDESADYSAEESVEAGFYSREEAEAAILARYDADDGLVVHECEEPDDEDDDKPGRPLIEILA